MEFDEAVINCFLENQTKLFPKTVAETMEEADEFLTECMAVVLSSVDEVWDYFDDSGIDISEMKKADILDADEVFDIGDGRFLVIMA